MKILASVILIGLFLLYSCTNKRQTEEVVFPQKNWEQITEAQSKNWNQQKLEEVRSLFGKIDLKALLVIDHGRIALSLGNPLDRHDVHSIRKVITGALIGIAEERKIIKLHETLEELGIDDKQPLSKMEKSASIENLLQADSGVYHEAAFLPPWAKAALPPRGSDKPGDRWAYNNWGFNVLEWIYERKTGQSIFQDFFTKIARPIGIEVEQLKTVERSGPSSLYSAHHYYLNAQELARIGLLFQESGSWNGNQIIHKDWLTRSWEKKWHIPGRGNFGYLWFIDLSYLYQCKIEGLDKFWPFTSYSNYAIVGYGGSVIFLVPELKLELIVMVDNDDFANRHKVKKEIFCDLLAALFRAKQK